MTREIECANSGGPPALARTAASAWIDHYYRWRLAAAVPERLVVAADGPTIPVRGREQVPLPDLDDPALDAIAVPAVIAALRRETLAGFVPLSFRLIDRAPAGPPPEPAPAERAPPPSAPRPAGVAELLRLDGSDFVYYAYLTVLDREPDWVGWAGYLAQLDGSFGAKIEVLRSLIGSSEARKRGNRARGIGVRVMYHRAAQHPLARSLRQALRRLGLVRPSPPPDPRDDATG